MKAGTHFYNYLAEANVICGMSATTVEDAISELSQKLEKSTAGVKSREIVDAVMEREKIIPTVISEGLAVPHARISGLQNLLVALGTSLDGIDFKMPSMPPVRVIILILTPKDNPSMHLQVLSALGKDFQDPPLIDRLCKITKPEELIKLFSASDISIPEFLTARDVMENGLVTLSESDTLGKTIETFALRSTSDIPVVDEEKDIRGIVSLEDILKLSLPEHLLWMNDLSPILYFQPFAETLKSESDTKIADFMRSDYVSVDEGVPAVQLAKIFLMKNIRQILVTRKSKLVGVVNLDSFIKKFFWA